MKNILKRCFSVFLAITIIFSSALVGLNELDFTGLFAIEAEAADEEQLTFELNDDNVSYSVSGNSAITGEVVIPDTYNYLPVTDIADYAFMGCTGLTSITIPDSITNIGDNAFVYCDNLESVNISDVGAWCKIDFDGYGACPLTFADYLYINGELAKHVIIPEGVTKIPDYAFACENITSIAIPDSVVDIADWAFFDCKNLSAVHITDIAAWCKLCIDSFSSPLQYANKLYINGELVTEVVIPDGVEIIPRFAFSCTNITSIVIPDSVKVIANSAFYKSPNLTSITIPEGISKIEAWAFYDCTNLSDVYITDIASWCNIDFENEYSNPLYYANNLYLNNELVTDVVIPDGVKEISDCGFSCENLTSVTIPDSMKSIGKMAFAGCKNLSSIVIPDSVKSIGERAFYECSALETVTLPENLTKIEYATFYNCKNLETITIPDTVKTIGDDAFNNCASLTSAELSDSLKNIEDSAFGDCTSLTSIVVPDSVMSIGDDAFSGCESLASIVLPDTVTRIGSGAFYETAYYENSDNWTDDVLYIGNCLIKAKSLSGNYVIKDNTTVVADHTFSYCSSLESIMIPDSVTSIGKFAFYYCSSLESIIIPDSVTTIGSFAFNTTAYYNNDSNWEDDVLYIGKHLIESRSISGTYEIKEGTKVIADNAFDYVDLSAITIPNSITHIGYGAFEGNHNISSVYISDIESWCNIVFKDEYSNPAGDSRDCYLYVDGKLTTDIVIPDSITNIKDYAFYFCTNIISIEISDSVKYIGDYSFYCCGGIETIKIPDSVKSIGCNAFQSCWNLKTVTIGSRVENIGDYAFENCSELVSIIIPGSVKTIGEKALGYIDNIINTKFIIYGVKASSAEVYANENGITFMGVCNHPSTKWVTEKKATVNSAGKKVKKCTECGEVLDTAKISQLKCGKPTLKSIENTEHGVLIKWGKISGADKYEVWRKTSSSGKYSKIATTSNTYYTDKKASSGKKYYYYVKAVNEAGSSSASSSKSIYHLADTTLKTPSSTKDGIKLKWSKITGAEGYKVYRKTGSGSYSCIATVKGSTKVAYTDKSAKKGKTYTYKIKVYKSKTYSAYSNAKKIKDKY